MTGDGAVLDFCGSFPDGDGIYDLTARVFKDTRVLRPAYAALFPKLDGRGNTAQEEPQVS
jgi:hypothetical protein